MPIRSFDYFATDLKWTRPIDPRDLKGMTIGVDAAFFIRRLSSIKEPCLAATGGLPFSFRASLKEELVRFKQLDIHLFFVFNGLQWKIERPFSFEDKRPVVRAQAWDLYASGNKSAAMGLWTNVGSVPQNDLFATVFEVLDELEIEYIRAPYCALAQLAFMDRSTRGFFDAVFAGSEYLLFHVDGCLTSIDLGKMQAVYIDKAVVLQGLGVTPTQFLDMGMLAGFDFISTFPPLLDGGSGFSFQNAVDAVRSSGSGVVVVRKFLGHPQVAKLNYFDLFARTRSSVLHHLIWDDSIGGVRPLNPDSAPNDLDELIGMRLPDIIYYCLMRCWISPQVLQTLTSGFLVEPHPLCNGDIVEFQRFIVGSEITRLRAQALAFLVTHLNESYKLQNVDSYVWFHPTQSTQMSFGQEIILFDTCKKWNLPSALLSDNSLKPFNAPSLEFCFALLANPAYAKRTLVGKKPEVVDRDFMPVEMTLANLMALAQCSYVDNNTHQLTPLGAALAHAMKKYHIRNISEWLWLACELIKAGGLQVDGYSSSFDVALKLDTTERKAIWLASRLACILPVHTTSLAYTGPLKRDLLSFHAFMRATSRSLRNLCEMTLLSRILKKVQNEREPNTRLPFHDDTSTLMGIMVATYLEECLKSANKEKAMAQVQELMSRWCTNIADDLKQFFVFWKALCLFVKEADEALRKWPGIDKVLDNFSQADKWISKYSL